MGIILMPAILFHLSLILAGGFLAGYKTNGILHKIKLISLSIEKVKGVCL